MDGRMESHEPEPAGCTCAGDLICWPCWLKIRPRECEYPPGSRSTCGYCREYLPPPGKTTT